MASFINPYEIYFKNMENGFLKGEGGINGGYSLPIEDGFRGFRWLHGSNGNHESDVRITCWSWEVLERKMV